MKMPSLRNIIRQFTWLAVLLAIAGAFAFPEPGGTLLKPYVVYFLMTLMFLGSLDIEYSAIKQNLKDGKKLLLLLASVHLATIIPLLAFRSFFTPEIYLGFVMIAVTASGMSNVFFSHLIGGNAGKALVLVSLSNLLSPLIVPLLVKIFAGAEVSFNYLEMTFTMAKLVMIPLLLARIVTWLKLKPLVKHWSPYLSFGAMTLLIYGVIAPVVGIILNNLVLSVTIGLLGFLFMNLTFLLGWKIGSDKPEKITYSLSVSFKNFTMAIVLCQSLFSPLAALPAIIYSVISNFMLAPIQMYYLFRRRE